MYLYWIWTVATAAVLYASFASIVWITTTMGPRKVKKLPHHCNDALVWRETHVSFCGYSVTPSRRFGRICPWFCPICDTLTRHVHGTNFLDFVNLRSMSGNRDSRVDEIPLNRVIDKASNQHTKFGKRYLPTWSIRYCASKSLPSS